jgi:hypothetical protein
MKTLNTKDYLESCRAMQQALTPSLNTTEYASLAGILSACIEFELSIDKVQTRLDYLTQENIRNTTPFLVKVDA